MFTNPTEIMALMERVRELEATLDVRENALGELTALYESQAVYLERNVASWCKTPFAHRIYELEMQSKTPARGLGI